MTTPKLKRRWFRFSLRTLLVFVVMLSVVLGWFAWKLEKARRQREAVEAILEAGGTVYFDYQVKEEGGVDYTAEPTTAPWLRKLLGNDLFCDVVAVYCEGTDFDDNDARHLQEIANLQILALADTQITDSGLRHLKGLIRLELLSLGGPQITDNGLKHLNGMTRLEGLSLAQTSVTDKGLAQLEGMTKLELLYMSDMSMTGRGVVTKNGQVHLKGILLLEINRFRNRHGEVSNENRLIGFDGCPSSRMRITGEGLGQLQQALPNCRIVYYSPSGQPQRTP